MGLFKTLVTLVVGVYAGVYIDQKYQVPKLDDPEALWEKVKVWLEHYKKEDGGPKKS